MAGFRREWIRDFYPWLVNHIRNDCNAVLRGMGRLWAVRTGELAATV